MPKGLIQVRDQKYLLVLLGGAGKCGDAAHRSGVDVGVRLSRAGWSGSPLSLPGQAWGWFAGGCVVREREEGDTM